MQGKKVDVIIHRGPMDQVPRTIWYHEQPILEQIHGTGTIIKAKGGKTYEPEEIPENGCSEYERLQRAYGMHKSQGIPMVEYVFGRPALNGIKQFYDTTKLDNLIPGETNIPENAFYMDPEGMTKEGLQNALDRIGLEYEPLASKDDLKAMLKEAMNGRVPKQPETEPEHESTVDSDSLEASMEGNQESQEPEGNSQGLGDAMSGANSEVNQ